MKHLVFDLDGTLVDSARFYDHSIGLTLKEFGIEPTKADIEHAYKFFNPKEFFATYFNSDIAEKATRWFLDMNAKNIPDIEVFSGMAEIVADLHQADIRLSVWTGRETHVGKLILETTGLDKYITQCVGRTCVTNNKPHPDGLLKILTDSKSQKNQVMMIGDHVYDMQAAKAAGVMGVSVTWLPEYDHGSDQYSDIHFNNIQIFAQWTKRLNNR